MIHREKDMHPKQQPSRFYLDEVYKPFKDESFRAFLNGETGKVDHQAWLYTSNVNVLPLAIGFAEVEHDTDTAAFSIQGVHDLLRRQRVLVPDVFSSTGGEIFSRRISGDLKNIQVDLTVPFGTNIAGEYRGFPDPRLFRDGAFVIHEFMKAGEPADAAPLIVPASDVTDFKGITLTASFIQRVPVLPVYESVVFEPAHL